MKLTKKIVLATSLVLSASCAMLFTANVSATGISQGSSGMWNAVVKYRSNSTPSGYAYDYIHATSLSACQAQVAGDLNYLGSSVILQCVYGGVTDSGSTPK